jgi:hypothetical protein
MNRLSLILKVGGALFLIGGAQSLGFQVQIDPRIEDARENLRQLQLEIPGNRLVNATLETLRDYRRVTSDAVKKRQALQMRQDFIQRFPENPQLAVEEFARVIAGLGARSDAEQELLGNLERNLATLTHIYTDRFAEARASYISPPWYLQPVAALMTRGTQGRQNLDFDHALFLMLTGQRSAANNIFTELRENSDSDEFISRVLFAQSRLQYDAYRVEQDPEYQRQAIQYAEQSLRHDADYEQPKLFLEYLLTIDLQAVEAEGTPPEGQGSGEAEGERGAISTDLPEH